MLPAAVQSANTVVKYVIADETVSFIQCEDFDESHEPVVGDLYTVTSDGRVSFRRSGADPWIYHHKWLFVADDYDGFDVETSKERSRQWLGLDGIDFRRIGKKSFWETAVVPRLT